MYVHANIFSHLLLSSKKTRKGQTTELVLFAVLSTLQQKHVHHFPSIYFHSDREVLIRDFAQTDGESPSLQIHNVCGCGTFELVFDLFTG